MLCVEQLTCGYGEKTVLYDAGLEVRDGTIFGIIGPNGCGKTTLLRVMSGVLRPRNGRVMFRGKDVRCIGINEIARRVAVVSQSPETTFMRVEEFVLLGRIPHYRKFQFLDTRKDMEIAQKSMALTDTLKIRNSFMSEISGGEKQLVLIARALAQEPELLLMDEPTTHLDITHQIGILDLVRKLNREFGLTVILVLHDLNLASEYCHRLALISEGCIHKVGRPEEVLNYKTIEEVYNTVVVVKKSPISSKPYVFAVPEEERKTR